MLSTYVPTQPGQDTSIRKQINLRDLQAMKKEIKDESRLLKKMLANEIKRNVWPMLKHSKRVRMLVMRKQKYLALLSRSYGLRSTQVESQILE